MPGLVSWEHQLHELDKDIRPAQYAVYKSTATCFSEDAPELHGIEGWERANLNIKLQMQ
jgi:hypothetical protein